MDLTKDLLSRLLDVESRLNRLESSNQVNKIAFTGTGGITATAGSIIDSTGLKSTTNFQNGSVFSGSHNTTSSTSYVDLPGSTLPNFTLTRNTVMYLFLDVYGANSNLHADGSIVEVQVVDNGSLVYNLAVVGVWDGSSVDEAFASKGNVVTFPAGSHTVKLQYKVVGTGTANVDSFDLGYIILGS